MSNGVAQRTGRIDIDLLASRDRDIESEATGITANEDGAVLRWARVDDSAGTVRGGALVEPEVGSVGVDVCEVNRGTRAERETAKDLGVDGCGARCRDCYC